MICNAINDNSKKKCTNNAIGEHGFCGVHVNVLKGGKAIRAFLTIKKSAVADSNNRNATTMDVTEGGCCPILVGDEKKECGKKPGDKGGNGLCGKHFRMFEEGKLLQVIANVSWTMVPANPAKAKSAAAKEVKKPKQNAVLNPKKVTSKSSSGGVAIRKAQRATKKADNVIEDVVGVPNGGGNAETDRAKTFHRKDGTKLVRTTRTKKFTDPTTGQTYSAIEIIEKEYDASGNLLTEDVIRAASGNSG